MISALMLLVAVWSVAATANEDGSRLWLRMEKSGTTATVTGVKCTAMTELQSYWQGGPVVLKRQKGMPADAYAIKSEGGKTVITAANDAGLLYGAFALLTGLIRPRTKNRNKKDRRSKVLSPACLDMLLFPALFLIGGFLFHILWETKSQYAMVYIYMLIPLTSFGYAMIYPDSFSL